MVSTTGVWTAFARVGDELGRLTGPRLAAYVRRGGTGERIAYTPRARPRRRAGPRTRALTFWTLSALGYLLFVGALVAVRYQPLDSNSVGYLSGDAPTI